MSIRTYIWNNRTVRNMPVWRNHIRCYSFKRIQQKYQEFLSYNGPQPPYSHVCQIGDPVLRLKASSVEMETVQTPAFQKVLEHLSKVMRRYEAFGLAAPQIGLPWQVFVVELTEKSLNAIDPQIRKVREMEAVPLTYFINPSLKIKDHTTVTFPEICPSVNGYFASVPRAKEVEITAIDKSGQPFTWLGKGWSARIVQHEFDHLTGTLYTDKMHSSTLCCSVWEEINKHQGKVKMAYRPH